MNQKGFAFPLVILIVILIFAACVYVLLPEKSVPRVDPELNNLAETNYSYINNLVGRQFLVSEIPNFEALERVNIPNFSDVRHALPYRNNLIVMGINRVVEYDPETKNIVRINNQTLSSIVSAAIISDNLYLAADAPNNKELPFPGKTQIYIVDLKSGKITGTLLDKDKKSYANLDIVAKDGVLWASSWDGFFKIDPSSGKVSLVNALAYGGTSYNLFMEKDTIVLFEGDTKYHYDETSQKLVKDETYKEGIAPLINKDAKDFGLDIPNYFAMSELINSKYYLFSPSKISTLKKGEMPKFYMDTRLADNDYYDVFKAKVSADESHALIILPIGGPMQAGVGLKYAMFANLINLKTGEVTDLLNNSLGSQDMEDYIKMIWEMNNYTTLETPEGFSIINNDQAEIMNVSVKTKQLKINNPYPKTSN